jgi:hypothetical protein
MEQLTKTPIEKVDLSALEQEQEYFCINQHNYQFLINPDSFGAYCITHIYLPTQSVEQTGDKIFFGTEQTVFRKEIYDLLLAQISRLNNKLRSLSPSESKTVEKEVKDGFGKWLEKEIKEHEYWKEKSLGDARKAYIVSIDILNNVLSEYRKFSLLSVKEPSKEVGKWISVEDRLPEFGGEYNVVWNLDDNDYPVSSTMEWCSINKIWTDERTGSTDVSSQILFWQEIAEPPKNIPKSIWFEIPKIPRKQAVNMEEFEGLAYGQCIHRENLANCDICNAPPNNTNN